MAAATLTEKGQIVIPAEIRSKYGLTLVHRRVTPSDPAKGATTRTTRERRGSAHVPAA